MKFLLSFIFLCLLVFSSSSQTISNYIFSWDTTASLQRSYGSLVDDIDLSSGTSIAIGGSNAIATSSSMNIGFDFWLYGVRYTSFYATSNGWIGIGNFVSPTNVWLSSFFGGV